MAILYILVGLFILWVIVIPVINYVILTIHDHFHPRYHWDDSQEKVSSLEQAENGISPKPLNLHEIENIVNKIEFKNYE